MAKARTAKSRGLTAACEGDDAFALGEQDLQVEGAVHTIQRNATKVMCKTCGTVKESHHFYVTDTDRCCRQCATSWSPKDIEYEGVRLKTPPGMSTTRLCGIHQSMWLDSSAQRRKVRDGAIEVASYLRKNEDLRIDEGRVNVPPATVLLLSPPYQVARSRLQDHHGCMASNIQKRLEHWPQHGSLPSYLPGREWRAPCEAAAGHPLRLHVG